MNPVHFIVCECCAASEWATNPARLFDDIESFESDRTVQVEVSQAISVSAAPPSISCRHVAISEALEGELQIDQEREAEAKVPAFWPFSPSPHHQDMRAAPPSISNFTANEQCLAHFSGSLHKKSHFLALGKETEWPEQGSGGELEVGEEREKIHYIADGIVPAKMRQMKKHSAGRQGVFCAFSNRGTFAFGRGNTIFCESTLECALKCSSPGFTTIQDRLGVSAGNDLFSHLLLEYPGPLAAPNPRVTELLVTFLSKAVQIRIEAFKIGRQLQESNQVCHLQVAGLWFLLLAFLKNGCDRQVIATQLFSDDQLRAAADFLESSLSGSMADCSRTRQQCRCADIGRLGRLLCLEGAATAAAEASALKLHAHALALGFSGGPEAFNEALAAFAKDHMSYTTQGVDFHVVTAPSAASSSCRGDVCGLWGNCLQSFYEMRSESELTKSERGKRKLSRS